MRLLRSPLLVTATVVGIMAMMVASADAALTFTPASTPFTGTLTGSLLFNTGSALSMTCTASSFSGTTPASGPSVSFNPAAFSGCTLSTGNSASIVVTTTTAACKWTLTASSATASGFSGALTMPGGKQADGTQCVSINVTSAGVTLCSYTFSSATISVTYVNATTSLKTDLANTVPYTSSGALCGVSGSGTLSAQYAIAPTSFQVTNT